MKVLKVYAIPKDTEEGAKQHRLALEQIESAMDLDYVVKAAAMADLHAGYSLPIGGVVATKNKVLPSWVGYDIGCGMCAVMTTFSSANIDRGKYEIHKALTAAIPTGFKIHEKAQMELCNIPGTLSELGKGVFEKKRGGKSAGTLGSGNHFIEIGCDAKNDSVWIILHSGSRGPGHGLATEYMKLASNSDKPKEGHYAFDADSYLGKWYLNDMEWMINYALDNRMRLLTQVMRVINLFTSGDMLNSTLINSTHNHIEQADGLYIHRKGATQAHDGMMGVIPGNMRQGTFIVKGKGNPESLNSCSHGAGRLMSRKEASASIKLEDFEKDMEGIAATVTEGTLDESREAYKDIHEVMEQQKDLVKVLSHIKPIINLKSDEKKRR